MGKDYLFGSTGSRIIKYANPSRLEYTRLPGTTGGVRYIRNYLNGNTDNAYSHWVQIQAFLMDGTNIALNKPVTASKTPIGTEPLSRITNGNIDTNSYVDFDPGEVNVQVDLGQAYLIDYIKIWHYYGNDRQQCHSPRIPQSFP